MALILMIAAGILLAVLLLPLLGPIAMIAISIGVIAWLGYCIFVCREWKTLRTYFRLLK